MGNSLATPWGSIRRLGRRRPPVLSGVTVTSPETCGASKGYV